MFRGVSFLVVMVTTGISSESEMTGAEMSYVTHKNEENCRSLQADNFKNSLRHVG